MLFKHKPYKSQLMVYSKKGVVVLCIRAYQEKKRAKQGK
jgi:hypothetical protein